MAHALLHKLKAKITGFFSFSPEIKPEFDLHSIGLKFGKDFPSKNKNPKSQGEGGIEGEIFSPRSTESWQDSNPRHLTNTWRSSGKL